MEVPRNNLDSYTNDQHAARFVNHALHLEPDGEIINLDYDPMRLYNNLQQANDGQLDEQFHHEITKMLQSYITLRKRVFKLARTPNCFYNDQFLKIGQIFQKYRVTDHLYEERQIAKAITMPRLMLLFPHLLAKIVTIDLNVESIIPYRVLTDSGLSHISPACLWKSSFCLLPKFIMDVGDPSHHMKIVKAMLLAHYEQHEVIHENNELRNKKTPIERMQAVTMICKVIYNSNHIVGNIRWAAYKTFFLNDPMNTMLKFDYDKAAETFESRFSEISPALQNIFGLKNGTGLEYGADTTEILKNFEKLK